MKRILITGANKGIGLATVAKLLGSYDETFLLLGSRDSKKGWESLRDGNIDMSLHQAEVIYDNGSTETGFWTGTKSDGTFSGYSCSGW